MAKTLIIKDADFSTNKLATVSFDAIPCESISIDSSISISGIGATATLTPVVTPSNTTDEITWTSSDTSVATVADGVITSHRPGTATITVTCGEQSDTCSVTVAISIVAVKNGLIAINYAQGSLVDFAALLNTSNNRYISVGTEENEYPAIGTIDTGDFAGIYPIQIPVGAKTITFEKTGLAPLIVFYNSKAKSTNSSASKVRDCAKVIDGETATGGTPYSISAWTYNSRTITIPDTEGIDSFTLGCYTKASSDYTNFDPSDPGITITFGYE